jgi:hypothetical protein
MEALRFSTPSLTSSIQLATSHNTRIFDNLLLQTACMEMHGRMVFGSREGLCERKTRVRVMTA